MAKPLLQKGEPGPVKVERNKPKYAGVVTCEHASNRLPKALKKNFGVPRAALDDHIGLDIGAADVSRHIAEKLGMPAVYSQYSRLVFDVNRHVRAASATPKISDPLRDGPIEIPGNMKLTPVVKAARAAALHAPYQAAVKAEIDAQVAAGLSPFVLSVHSCTPWMHGKKRPWHIGVLWDHDEKTGRALIRALEKQNPRLCIGDNEPYSLKDDRMKWAAVRHHAGRRGLPHVLVEFRNDLVGTPAGARKWGDILIKALLPLLEKV